MSADRPSGRTGLLRSTRGPLAAAIGAVTGLLLAACGSVGGTPAPAGPAPATAAPGGSKVQMPETATDQPSVSASPSLSPATSSPALAADTTVPSVGTEPAGRTSTGPIAGLPHSTPLPPNELVDSRVIDGVADLYVVDTATGMLGDRLSKDLGGAQYPVLSPDRGTMAYLWAGKDGIQLRVAAVDGSGDRPLLSSATADQCGNPGRPGWNPIDPTEIVLACRGEDSSRMDLVGVDGTIRSTLYPGVPVFEDPTYSPDGRLIAFWGSGDPKASGGSLYVMPADGSGPARQITTPGAAEDVDPMWTVDGTSLVFKRSVPDSGVGQILLLAVGGPTPGTITAVTDGTAFDADPTVAPDGRQLAFRSNRTNAAGNNDVQTWIQNLDGTGLRQVALGVAGTTAGAAEWGRR